MTDRHENTLTMFDEVETYCDANTTATAPITAFATTLTAFKAVVTDIKSTAQSTELPLGGLAETKDGLKKDAADECAAICKAISSYALGLIPPNTTLAGQVKYTRSGLEKERDETLPQILNNIYTLANGLVTVTPPATNPLAGYGVDTTRLTAYQTMITNYVAAISGPRDGVVNRKTSNSQLDDLFDQASGVLKNQLDGLALQVGGTFYAGYLNARKIVNDGVRHTRVAGTITDNTTGLPIYGVTVVSAPGNYNTLSDSSGNYSLDVPDFHVPYYTIKFDRAGYLELQQAGVTVSRGNTTTVNVVLIPG